MDKIRTLIVDDERPALRALRGLLEQQPDLILAGEATDGERALEFIQAHRPELVFLDIQMPMLTGLELLRKLPPAARPEIVFVTAHDEFAVKAFEFHAVDYLVKPFSDGRFRTAVERAVKRIRSGSLSATEQALRGLLEHFQNCRPPPAADHARLVVRADGQLLFLEQREIRWIEGQGDFVKIHLVKGAVLTRLTMTRLVEQLDPGRFERIHKSTIVNLSYVRRIKPMMARSQGMELDDGTALPIGASYAAVLDRLK